MSNVLTTQSTVSCGHGGTVAAQGTAKLAVNGAPVLQKSGVEEQRVDNCITKPTQPDPTATACKKVSKVDGGLAAKLAIDGQPVLLDTLAGATDGKVAGVTPQPLPPAKAIQTKLSST
jgi:hypothetical protein